MPSDTQIVPPGESRRVLVICNSATVAMLIVNLLKRWGLVPNPDMEAGDTYSLVIADADCADHRLADARRDGVPWLAVRGSGASRIASDASAWISKPIVADMLHEAVMRCLVAQTAQFEDGIDLNVVTELWGSSESTSFRLVLDIFLGEVQTGLASMKDASERGDRNSVLMEAHSLASASANVGAAAMSRAARTLETLAPYAEKAQLSDLVRELHNIAERDLPILRRLTSGTGDD